MVLPSRTSTLRISLNTWGSEAVKTTAVGTWKTSPFCKWQMETKWFISKKIQPKPGKSVWKIKPEVLLNKCGAQTAVKGTP